MRKAALAAVALVLVVSGSAIGVKVYKDNFVPQPQSYASYGYGGYGYGGCSGGSAGGCCSRPGSGGGPAATLDATKKLAKDYYVKKYKDGNVSVEVKDFGCHQEAYILKGGRSVKRLSISGGNVYEIG
jgi:hypothetical protein